MIQNIRQTIKIPVAALIGSPIPAKFHEIRKEAISNPDKLEELLKEAAESLPPDTKTELQSYGCTLPTDIIDLTLSLGHFLFTMFLTNLQKPVAPLNQKALEMKILRLSEEFEKDEFEIPDYAVKQIVANMTDDVNWPTFSLDVVYESKDHKGQTKVIIKALEHFPLINQAAQEVLVGYLN